MDDNIYLCGRTVRNNSRGFDGQLSELLIFDSSLTAEQIEGLYLIETVGFNPTYGTCSLGWRGVCDPITGHQNTQFVSHGALHSTLAGGLLFIGYCCGFFLENSLVGIHSHSCKSGKIKFWIHDSSLLRSDSIPANMKLLICRSWRHLSRIQAAVPWPPAALRRTLQAPASSPPPLACGPSMARQCACFRPTQVKLLPHQTPCQTPFFHCNCRSDGMQKRTD